MNLNDEIDAYLAGLSPAPSKADRLTFKVQCERAQLSPMTRQIYMVNRGGKWSIQVSIDGFRSIAARNPNYDGQEGPFWCDGPNGAWTDIPTEGKPYAAKVGIRTKKPDGSVSVTWTSAKFADYASGPMWNKFSCTMIAKCAEALGLRRALPDALSGLYAEEEMTQADKPPPKAAPEPELTSTDAAPDGLEGELMAELEKIVAAPGDAGLRDQLLSAVATKARALPKAGQVRLAAAIKAGRAKLRGA